MRASASWAHLEDGVLFLLLGAVRPILAREHLATDDDALHPWRRLQGGVADITGLLAENGA